MFSDVQLRTAIDTWIRMYGIEETSIAAVVRGAGIRVPHGSRYLPMLQAVGRILASLGFKHYRCMIKGERGYRYRRNPHANPPLQHDPDLLEADVIDPTFGAYTYQPPVQPPPSADPLAGVHPLAGMSKRTFSIYTTEREHEEFMEAAQAAELSLSAYVLTLARIAKPYVQPGYARAHYGEHEDTIARGKPGRRPR